MRRRWPGFWKIRSTSTQQLNKTLGRICQSEGLGSTVKIHSGSEDVPPSPLDHGNLPCPCLQVFSKRMPSFPPSLNRDSVPRSDDDANPTPGNPLSHDRRSRRSASPESPSYASPAPVLPPRQSIAVGGLLGSWAECQTDLSPQTSVPTPKVAELKANPIPSNYLFVIHFCIMTQYIYEYPPASSHK